MHTLSSINESQPVSKRTSSQSVDLNQKNTSAIFDLLSQQKKYQESYGQQQQSIQMSLFVKQSLQEPSTSYKFQVKEGSLENDPENRDQYLF